MEKKEKLFKSGPGLISISSPASCRVSRPRLAGSVKGWKVGKMRGGGGVKKSCGSEIPG